MTANRSSRQSRSLAEQDLEALRFVERVLPVPAMLLSVLVVLHSTRPWVTGGLLAAFVAINVGLSQIALRRGRAWGDRTNELRYLFDFVVLVMLGMMAGPRAPAMLMAIPPACAAPFLFRDWRAWGAIVGVATSAFVGTLLAGAAAMDLVPLFVAELGIGVIMVAVVVELRRREAEREQAIEQVNRASQAKSEFLSIMSHEVRTPLHGMMGTISLLEQDEELDDRTRTRLATVSTCGQDVLRVLGDVLQMSQMQSEDVELPQHELVVSELVGKAVERARGMVGERNLELVTELDPGLSHHYRGPAEAIGHVLDRLLHNAVSFTQEGRVTVAVAQGSGHLCFTVRDTGVGIPQPALSGLFSAFTQLDATTTRTHGGTGLGLAISQRIVEHLGGRIEACSEVGVGSSFSFTIPCEALAEAPARATEEAREDETRATPPDVEHPVLVVDDNAINRRVMVAMLEKLGYRADTVNDGQQAVERTRASTYPLILMDCFMPVMDGYEATRLIRERDGRRSRIIGVTADALANARRRCLDAGMDDYVAKPVPLEALRTLLDEGTGATTSAGRP